MAGDLHEIMDRLQVVIDQAQAALDALAAIANPVGTEFAVPGGEFGAAPTEIPSKKCNEKSDHASHYWFDDGPGNDQAGAMWDCPGVQTLPAMMCPRDEQHDAHAWFIGQIDDPDAPADDNHWCPGMPF